MLILRFYELEASAENIQLFLSLGKHQATHLVLKFKHDMKSRDLAPATIDRSSDRGAPLFGEVCIEYW
ncbi:MAG: hypothetical protein QNJ74_22985 [Trichodesmium sp. MO_231.B1]|nr:hypothetical protein [Trichodesmium sp. MO_231.B1]